METIAIVGDFHGARSTKLEQFLKAHDITQLICLGDFDTVESILQFKDLEERLTAAGGKVLKVSGNHDHAYLNDLEISSPTMRALGKNYYQLRAEILSDPDALKYLKYLTESPFGIKVPIAEGVNIYILHGGFAGHLSRGIPSDASALWYRLSSNYYEDTKIWAAETFEKMKEKGAQILIRGHDHAPIIRKETKEGLDSRLPSDIKEEGMVIDPSLSRYIINPGAYHDGCIASLEVDPNNPEMKFRFHNVTGQS